MNTLRLLIYKVVEGKIMTMIDVINIIEVVVSATTLLFAIYQASKLRRLKKIEKKLLLYS